MKSAACVFRGRRALVLCYLDDLLVMAESVQILSEMKRRLTELQPDNELNEAVDYLGIQLIRADDDSITLQEQKYVENIVVEMGLTESLSSKVACDVAENLSTPSEEEADEDIPSCHLISSLLYLATNTSPDIAEATSIPHLHAE